MQKSIWDSTKKTFYPLALIFTIGHWLGAIKIRFGYIRLARRTVSSAFKSQAANIVFVTPPEAKNSNSVGLYHQGLARNKSLTCKNHSGIPQKKTFYPLALIFTIGLCLGACVVRSKQKTTKIFKHRQPKTVLL